MRPCHTAQRPALRARRRPARRRPRLATRVPCYAGAREQPAPTAAPAPAGHAALSADGRTAIAPADAPPQVQEAVAAANRIIRMPYGYGGGHGRFHDSGYDCSRAVSYVLHGAGLLRRARDSRGLGFAYIVIAGLRFDTSGRGASEPRWRTEPRSARGYAARHAGASDA